MTPEHETEPSIEAAARKVIEAWRAIPECELPPPPKSLPVGADISAWLRENPPQPLPPHPDGYFEAWGAFWDAVRDLERKLNAA
jgi:hypothetical protein